MALKIVEILFDFGTKTFTNVFDFFIVFLIAIGNRLCVLGLFLIRLKHVIVNRGLVF